jgi:hypothetical protein
MAQLLGSSGKGTKRGGRWSAHSSTQVVSTQQHSGGQHTAALRWSAHSSTQVVSTQQHSVPILADIIDVPDVACSCE